MSHRFSEALIKSSLKLPRTSFPMRANAASREVLSVPKLTSILYRRQAQDPSVRPSFRLHDGPPYANGSLHMGHFLNKVLKDTINRHRLLSGYRIDYTPGWDCHGLPIELKALEEMAAAAAASAKAASSTVSPSASSPPKSSGVGSSKSKASSPQGASALLRQTVDPMLVRQHARQLAERAIASQRTDFERWGILADWHTSDLRRRNSSLTEERQKTGVPTAEATTSLSPLSIVNTQKPNSGGDGVYVTMDRSYVATQLTVFCAMVERGLIYRASKPVYWSPVARSALAEAELEYAEAHESTAVYVSFPLAVEGGRGWKDCAGPKAKSLLSKHSSAASLSALIWTTTLWSLPGNVALAVSPVMEYVLASFSDSDAASKKTFLVAKERVEDLERILQQGSSSGYASKINDRENGDEPPNVENRSIVAAETSVQHPHQPPSPSSSSMVLEISESFLGKELEGAIFQRPDALRRASASLNSPLPLTCNDSPVLCADYVTSDAGTGIVHTAPGHGHDDWLSVMRYNTALSHKADKGESTARDKTAKDDASPPPLPVPCPVDGRGFFTQEAGAAFIGLYALKEGAAAIMDALHSTGQLLHREQHIHRYPYDWRSKTPVIIRATPQWFVKVDALLASANAAIEGVSMIPTTSRNRLTATVGSRTDWCISRQRSWGVPIPALYHLDTEAAAASVEGGEELPETARVLLTPESIRHVASILSTHARGSDAWWTEPVETFLPPSVTASSESSRSGNKVVASPQVVWKKGGDTLDVWFDSGTSWASSLSSSSIPSPTLQMLSDALLLGGSNKPAEKIVADLVLEGSDQHRGWFQSSLLTSIAVQGAAPYAQIVTHGFVLDEKGRKMSKSLGNVVTPADIISEPVSQKQGNTGGSGAATPPSTKGKQQKQQQQQQHKAAGGGDEKGGNASTGVGADVLRYWVASSDYTRDISIGPTILATSAEAVRKIRNTARFILGNLVDWRHADFQEGGAVATAEPTAQNERKEQTDNLSSAASSTLDGGLLRAWSSPPTSLGTLKSVSSTSGSQIKTRPTVRLRFLDRSLLHKVYAFQVEVNEAYSKHAFMRVTTSINSFASLDLSSHYFDFCKDRLYAGENYDVVDEGEGGGGGGRRAAQLVLWESLRALTRAIAPILPFIADEIYVHSAQFLCAPPDTAASGSADASASAPVSPPLVPNSSVFDVVFPAPPPEWKDDELGQMLDSLLFLRSEVNKLLEKARLEKHIGSALEASVELRFLGDRAAAATTTAADSSSSNALLKKAIMQASKDGQLVDLLVVSNVEIVQTVEEAEKLSGPTSQESSDTVESPRGFFYTAMVGDASTADTSGVTITVRPALGSKCARCWKHCAPPKSGDVSVTEPPSLCLRCHSLLIRDEKQ